MIIQIIINKNEAVAVRLIKRKKCLAEEIWEDKLDLSRNLLKKIDDLLRKNNVDLDKISGYKIISDVPDNWTTYRIAKITFESLMLAKKIGL